jgi:glucose/arabinose dehydrogenase
MAREHFRDPPWVNGLLYCLETVIQSTDTLAFTTLATAPDGTLYAARPLSGQVLAITDSDGDQLPDSSAVAVEGLTLPTGLAYHDGVLYVLASANLYAWADDELTLLVDDVPLSASQWAGQIVVGPDERLYVSVAAGCDFCQPAQPEHGAILSYGLDGTDRQIIATGLRQAAGLAFLDGKLWATDSARTGLFDTPDLDELNRITAGAAYGWPECIGVDNRPDPELETTADCADRTGPELTFPTGSTPLGIVTYHGDTLPDLTGTLLVTLNGSRNQPDLRGYLLAAVRLDNGIPMEYEILIPYETRRDTFTLAEMNYRGSGFWPQRPMGVAVSPEGWIYISAGTEILVLRPTS